MDEDIFIWLGGSFSPPTNAHLNIAEMVGIFMRNKTGKRVRLFFVPVNDYYTKPSVLCVAGPEHHRIHMLRLATDYLNSRRNENLLFDVDDIEFTEGENTKKPIKTVDSVTIFTKKHNANPDNVYIMQGQDNIAAILAGKWHGTEALVFNSKLLCIPREAVEGKDIVQATKDSLRKQIDVSKFTNKTEEEIMNRITILDTVPKLDSSTDLRKFIRQGNFHLVKEKTIEPISAYIEHKGLYKDIICETAKQGGKRKKTLRRRNRRRISRKHFSTVLYSWKKSRNTALLQ